MSPDISPTSPLPRFNVRIPIPDLSAWRAGNIGIPGVWSFSAAQPGPHLVVVALMHGNEFAGAIVLDRLLRAGVRPERGRLTLIFANLTAFDRFDAANPVITRFIDEDMNRVWEPSLLDGDTQTLELTRARTLRPMIEQADVLLDLHTMLVDSAPLILCGNGDKGRKLAQELASPHLIIADAGHAGGRRLIDYPAFLSPGNSRCAILLEAGQHWAPEAVDVSADMLTRIGALTGVLPAPPMPQTTPRLAEVTHAITAHSNAFSFVQSWQGLDRIAQRNTLLAMDGDTEIRTPYANCILVMPALRPARGHTAVRLARMTG